MTEQSIVTTTRHALINESEDFYKRRQPHRANMRADAPTGERNAAFDAYEGFVTAGSYAWTLAAMLRWLAADHGEEYAAKFAAVVADVMENGIEYMEDANSDLYPTATGIEVAR